MMRSRFAANVVSVLAIVAVLALLGAFEVRAQSSPVSTQDKPSAIEIVKVELTTDPSPAEKGTNTVRVKLTDRSGKPISGARVAVTFLMPAMPSMGMAAMKTVIKAVDKGDGTYEGKADLGSGGTWQVLVIAQQNGKTIANKRLTVEATGGM